MDCHHKRRYQHPGSIGNIDGATLCRISANRIADTIAARPNELEALTDSAKGLNRKFSDLVDAASQYAESANKLRAATEETVKAADWIAGNYSCDGVAVHNARGFVADMAFLIIGRALNLSKIAL